MKLILIRHGDPDYELDSLTEKGFKEAEYLSQRISKLKVDEFYVSPLGRAKDTAKPTLEKMGQEATVLEWAKEFTGWCIRPDVNRKIICWDWLPADWTGEPLFYDKDRWFDAKAFDGTNVKEEYLYVTGQFKEFLRSHGYEWNGKYFDVKKSNSDTIVIFCHYGITIVMLSMLLGISPMLMWHGFVSAPTGVTTLTTEERSEGKAYFRMSSYGDISHLYANDEEPAFAARFCEKFTDDTRHV